VALRLFLFLSLFLVAASSKAPSSVASKDTTGVLLGWVRDSVSNQPLDGANVTVLGARMGAMTDTLGRFEIAGLRPGSYEVRASSPESERRQLLLQIRAGQRDTVVFRLPRPAWFHYDYDMGSARPFRLDSIPRPHR